NVSLRSLVSDEAFTISSGSLTITGAAASQINATFNMTGGTLNIAVIGALFTATGSGTISNATLGAENGGVLSLPVTSGLASVNLTASGGGKILLPAATTYTTSSGNTVQASGTGSRIDLSALRSFGGSSGTATVTASAGGEVDLAGEITGATQLTLSDAGSVL